MAKNKTVNRRKGESDVMFMERAAAVAAKVSGSVDSGMGAICPSCAPFGSCEGQEVVEILPYAHCYNCDYGKL